MSNASEFIDALNQSFRNSAELEQIEILFYSDSAALHDDFVDFFKKLKVNNKDLIVTRNSFAETTFGPLVQGGKEYCNSFVPLYTLVRSNEILKKPLNAIQNIFVNKDPFYIESNKKAFEKCLKHRYDIEKQEFAFKRSSSFQGKDKANLLEEARELAKKRHPFSNSMEIEFLAKGVYAQEVYPYSQGNSVENNSFPNFQKWKSKNEKRIYREFLESSINGAKALGGGNYKIVSNPNALYNLSIQSDLETLGKANFNLNLKKTSSGRETVIKLSSPISGEFLNDLKKFAFRLKSSFPRVLPHFENAFDNALDNLVPNSISGNNFRISRAFEFQDSVYLNTEISREWEELKITEDKKNALFSIQSESSLSHTIPYPLGFDPNAIVVKDKNGKQVAVQNFKIFQNGPSGVLFIESESPIEVEIFFKKGKKGMDPVIYVSKFKKLFSERLSHLGEEFNLEFERQTRGKKQIRLSDLTRIIQDSSAYANCPTNTGIDPNLPGFEKYSKLLRNKKLTGVCRHFAFLLEDIGFKYFEDKDWLTQLRRRRGFLVGPLESTPYEDPHAFLTLESKNGGITVFDATPSTLVNPNLPKYSPPNEKSQDLTFSRANENPLKNSNFSYTTQDFNVEYKRFLKKLERLDKNGVFASEKNLKDKIFRTIQTAKRLSERIDADDPNIETLAVALENHLNDLQIFSSNSNRSSKSRRTQEIVADLVKELSPFQNLVQVGKTSCFKKSLKEVSKKLSKSN